MVEAHRTLDEIPASDLADEYDEPLEAPEGKQWVDAQVVLRLGVGDPRVFSHHQWSLIDFRDVTHAPDAEAMRKGTDTLPDRVEQRGGTRETYTVYWAVEYTSQLTFVMEQYGGQEGPTIRIE
jgi:hypothetical protein